MTTPDNHDVIPRDLHFITDAAKSKAWLGGDPVGSAVFNAMSITFPDGERMFIDSVRNYRPELTGKLLEQAKAFIVQEAIHTREHVGMNAHLDRSHYPLDQIESELRARQEIVRGRGPVAMLAATMCLEHFTAMMADWFLDNPKIWEGVDPEIAKLWQWHAMEESEHKAVAYDVFMAIAKDWSPLQRYMLRVRVMAIITVMFTLNISRFSALLLAADGMDFKKARRATLGYLLWKPGLFRISWSSYWDWYRPGFHPWDKTDQDKLARWRAVFPPPAAPAAA